MHSTKNLAPLILLDPVVDGMIWTVVQYPILTSIHLLTFVRCSIQVSTWFANARRRLKKENKMTWEPKNKLDDEDVDVSDDDTDKDKDDDKHGEDNKERWWAP